MWLDLGSLAFTQYHVVGQLKEGDIIIILLFSVQKMGSSSVINNAFFFFFKVDEHLCKRPG